ncbi:WbqC family protein [Flavihumibacter fluvii]|uniref:WbqC family protein n=1 Tax=Flavihumibacter fluvii TaxID=2838157 RepID=UPI001BDF178C|nr:WbqC family protein [Flavihumibacter fluvii]ULQ52437.1 WbqC family protein [Flavihumibacter fluvii]
MQIAIMQPYFFPYIGYFQLISAVDKFIFLDDVAFIKKGWINRNKINLHGKEYLFSIPLKHLSQNKTIAETEISYDHEWIEKLTSNIRLAYMHSPFFEPVFNMICSLLAERPEKINWLAQQSIKATCNYLTLDSRMSCSTEMNLDNSLKGEARIIEICLKEGATAYLNLPGGKSLYKKAAFAERGIELLFLDPMDITYPQKSQAFIRGLSMIDVLMNNSPGDVKQLLNQYTLS